MSKAVSKTMNIILGEGPFAGGFAIGTDSRDFSSVREAINDLGHKHGCHTCGSKDPGTKETDTKGRTNFIPDHQPSIGIGSVLSPPLTAYRLYPHCSICSSQQWSTGMSRRYIAYMDANAPGWKSEVKAEWFYTTDRVIRSYRRRAKPAPWTQLKNRDSSYSMIKSGKPVKRRQIKDRIPGVRYEPYK
jgi:hypothetical protein